MVVSYFWGALHDAGRLPELWERLRRFTLDLVLSGRAGAGDESGELVRSEIFRGEIFFAAAPVWARKVRAFPKDLSKLPLIIPSRASPLWEEVQHFLKRQGVHPPLIVEMQDAGLMRQAALNGLGAASLSGLAAEEDLKRGILMRLGRPPSGITQTLWLAARKDYEPDSLIGGLMRKFRIPRRPARTGPFQFAAET